MKNENLTAYDKFLMSKQTATNAAVTISEERNESGYNLSNAYAEYLEAQLRRTTPSGEKVLTEEEFFNTGVNTKKSKKLRSKVTTEEETVTYGKTSAVQFKKSGKLFFACYVIIMIALALIVIVKTTVGDSYNADAADDTTASVEKIQTMQDEESPENDNWFDKMCDSLN